MAESCFQAHDSAETAVVVYGLDQQRGQGEGKGAEEQESLTLTTNIAGDRLNVLVLCVMVRCCEGKWWAKPHTLLFSPTHPYGRKETEATQGDKQQAGEASWLK